MSSPEVEVHTHTSPSRGRVKRARERKKERIHSECCGAQQLDRHKGRRLFLIVRFTISSGVLLPKNRCTDSTEAFKVDAIVSTAPV